MGELIVNFLKNNGLVSAFALVGIITFISEATSRKVFKGKIASSAIAILIGLVIAYIGGSIAQGEKGIADVAIFSGMGLLGGSMLRDFTIVSTAFGAEISEIKKCGFIGVISLLLGILASYIAGIIAALAFGYRDAISLATIGAGAVTFVVGPVTGTALGADSAVLALSIAAGVVKSVAVMVVTPFIAKRIGLTTPKAAMIYGGLMGTTSGTAAGLAATDQKLVPYGAMTATFYTGLGCLLCPSVLYAVTRLIF